MKNLLALFAVMSLAGPAWAAGDAEAGKAAAEACFACHGENGVSVAQTIPNLAGQKAPYLEAQLKAFRENKRTNPLMNAMAGPLSDADIENLAAYFGGLPAAGGADVSDLVPAINRTRVEFPADYAGRFTHYTTINFPDRKQVRRYLANDAALRAAGAGEPLPQGSMFLVEVYAARLDGDGKPVMGADGFLEAEKLTGFTAMETRPGWGEGLPDALRNGDWNYAVFAADGALRENVNQALCFACHKPLAEASYVFSLEALAAKAKAQ